MRAVLLLASFTFLAVAFTACTGSRSEPIAEPAGVTLEVEVPHEGLAIFRSPTFR
ncbi:MAG: hypothetical protein KJ048_00420 [Dehalococcoidia bacterium]|nr:hypothetical protein [Dehalococcoidia bacterium]MCZ7579161.1 hypothetical protein [Dehalococcoidia bacterium]